MNQTAQQGETHSEVLWLSPSKMVFDPSLGEPCWRCGKGMWIVAERNRSLRCFHCSSETADFLCWFCKNGISIKLLALDDQPSCLQGRQSGWVKFCEDFEPETPFGENWRKDLGERAKKARKLLSKIRVESCIFCHHKNTENVAKLIKGWEPENSSESPRLAGKIFNGKREVGGLYLCCDAAFCELNEDSYGSKGSCNNFKPSSDSVTFFRRQKTKLPDYLHTIQFLELLYPPRALGCVLSSMLDKKSPQNDQPSKQTGA